MTKGEAVTLANRCNKIMSGYLGRSCTVSLALTGALQIEFDDGNYITWTVTGINAPYVKWVGFHYRLNEDLAKIKECVDDNRDIFEKLIWSYEHWDELE